MRLLGLALAFVLVSGCGSDMVSIRLGGAFTADRTDEDIAEFHTIVDPYPGDVVIMESFPEQFTIRGIDSVECRDLQEILRSKSYIAQVGGCESYTV